MNVYIWTSGELKNAYIGEYHWYSFDFRNKTQSQAEANWWTIGGTYNSDANGWYTSIWSYLDKSIDIVGHNKITITAEMNIYSAYSAGALCFGVWDGSNRMWEFTSGNTSSDRGIWFQIWSNRIGWDNHATISGATTLTYIIDFQNLSMSAKIVNWVNERTRTQSFSSAQASAAQTSNATIYIYPDNVNHRLKILSYIIE